MASCLALLVAAAIAVALPTVGGAEETGGFSGTVRAEGGAPLADVDVCVYGAGALSTPIECRSTGPAETYEFTGLAPGQYTVEFAPPAPAEYFTQYYSGATSADLATPVEVTAGAITPGIDATLAMVPSPGPGKITGKVVAEGTGLPVVGVEVCAEQVVVAGSLCAATTSTGEYEIGGLAPGQYTVEFTPPAEYFAQYYLGVTSAGLATPVEVTAGAITPNIDATLQKPPSGPGKISGTVHAGAESGPTVAGVKACAEQVGVSGSRCQTTTSEGKYAFSDLPAGEWKLTFDAGGTRQNLLSQAYPNEEFWEAPTPFPLGPDAEEVKNVVLKAGGQIRGTARVAATGAPAAGVRVCLTEAGHFASRACLTTPTSGEYGFIAIWPGSFKVVFSAAAGEFPDATPIADAYVTQWWSGQPTYATATPIAVAPPATVAGIDASLAPPSSTSSPAPAASAVSAIAARAKKRKCRAGHKRRKVKGKLRCVKVKKHKKKGKHHRKKAKKHHKKSA